MRVAAIDVGGTKTAFGIVDCPSGGIEEWDSIPTPAGVSGHGEFLDDVVNRTRRLALRHRAAAIGMSVCELVSPGQRITSGHRVKWDGIDVRAILSEIAPAVIEADVRAAALAEARLGAGRGFSSFLYVNIGTGISSSLVLDGRVHAGANGNALALASSPVELRCPHCGAMASQTVEDAAGGSGLVEQARMMGLDVEGAAELFTRRDPASRRIADAACLALGVTLGIAVNLLDPHAVILGGGLILASAEYREQAISHIRSHIWAPRTRQLPILPAALGGHSALIGAALRAADQTR